jgi:hypothetical protein
VNANRTLYVKLAAVFPSANNAMTTQGAPCVRLGTVYKVEYKPKVVIDDVTCAGVLSLGVEGGFQGSQGSVDVDNPPQITFYLSENNYTDFKDDRSVMKWFTTHKTGWVTHSHVNQANATDQKENKKTGKCMKTGMLTDDAGGYKSDPDGDDADDEVPESQAADDLPDALNLGRNEPGGGAANPPLPPAAPPSLPPSETKAQEKEAAEAKAAALKAAAAQKEMDALVQAEVNKRLAAAQAAGRFVCFEL